MQRTLHVDLKLMLCCFFSLCHHRVIPMFGRKISLFLLFVHHADCTRIRAAYWGWDLIVRTCLLATLLRAIESKIMANCFQFTAIMSRLWLSVLRLGESVFFFFFFFNFVFYIYKYASCLIFFYVDRLSFDVWNGKIQHTSATWEILSKVMTYRSKSTYYVSKRICFGILRIDDSKVSASGLLLISSQTQSRGLFHSTHAKVILLSHKFLASSTQPKFWISRSINVQLTSKTSCQGNQIVHLSEYCHTNILCSLCSLHGSLFFFVLRSSQSFFHLFAIPHFVSISITFRAFSSPYKKKCGSSKVGLHKTQNACSIAPRSLGQSLSWTSISKRFRRMCVFIESTQANATSVQVDSFSRALWRLCVVRARVARSAKLAQSNHWWQWKQLKTMFVHCCSARSNSTKIQPFFVVCMRSIIWSIRSSIKHE